MERKIGETFEYEGEKLKVVANDSACVGCFFKEKLCDNRNRDITGTCGWTRKDNLFAIFIKVTEGQQDEQSQKLNLCEILKDCPQGWKFWSPLLGKVKLHYVCKDGVIVRTVEHTSWKLNQDGTVTIGASTSPEIMLYPSEKQKDWSKFTAPWLKGERFDPKTLKAFDRVLVRDLCPSTWRCTFYSHTKEDGSKWKYITGNSAYECCIPYNDETKHLVGTTKEAPEFYRYWED